MKYLLICISNNTSPLNKAYARCRIDVQTVLSGNQFHEFYTSSVLAIASTAMRVKRWTHQARHMENMRKNITRCD